MLLAGPAPDRLGRIARNFNFAVGAEDAADPRPQHAQVIVDLGDRAHGTAPAGYGVALFDGDGRADAVDPVDIGLGQAGQKLPRVSRQGFDITALAFRIKRIKDQR